MTKKTVKNTAFVLLVFCTIATAFAFTRPQGWVQFESKEFRFKIEFPSAPELTSQLANTALGAMTLHIAQLDVSGDSLNSNLVYMVNYTMFPDSINSDRKDKLVQFFNGSINGLVKNVQGTLISQKEIDYKGYPGRQILVDMQGQATITAKLILIKNKYFNIMVMTTPKKENNADIGKFFNSFEGE